MTTKDDRPSWEQTLAKWDAQDRAARHGFLCMAIGLSMGLTSLLVIYRPTASLLTVGAGCILFAFGVVHAWRNSWGAP